MSSEEPDGDDHGDVSPVTSPSQGVLLSPSDGVLLSPSDGVLLSPSEGLLLSPSEGLLLPPRKRWYAIGGTIAAIGLIGGITLFVVLLVGLTNRGPDDNQAFGNNTATKVHVDAGESKTIYVTPTSAYGYLACTARDEKGQKKADVIPYSSSVTFNHWRAAFTLSPRDSDDYMISCLGPAEARYGIADHVGIAEFAAPFVAAAVGVVVFVAGLAVVIVTAVRHIRANRKPASVPPEQPVAPEAT